MTLLRWSRCAISPAALARSGLPEATGPRSLLTGPIPERQIRDRVVVLPAEDDLTPHGPDRVNGPGRSVLV